MENEKQYRDALQNILDKGEKRKDRTGVGTISLFGQITMCFDLEKGFPMITAKKVHFFHILEELLFFLSGKTDTKILEEKGVNIWKGNTRKDFLEKRGLEYDEGEMGPGYGFQWRHSGAKYPLVEDDPGVDQIQLLHDTLKMDPYSRRMVMNTWIPKDIPNMAVPPCHVFFQLFVRDDKYLDGMMVQRSGDMFLGIPYNITSYSLLLTMYAKCHDLIPGKLTIHIGDAHIYNNSIEQTKEYLSREPLEPPKVNILTKKEHVYDYTSSDIELCNYKHLSFIKAKMAV